MDQLKETLSLGFEELGIEADEAAFSGYRSYFDFLEEKNRVMNLTAISGEKDVACLHFLDCVALTEICDFSGKKVIDIGSGAGFPGLPLKIICPEMSLTMLDAQQKRVTFLSQLVEKTGLTDVSCIHARAEEAAAKAPMREGFDIAVSRAVARLSVLAELCLPFVKKGGSFIAMKGVDSEEEISQAKSAIKALGGKIEKVYDYVVPQTDIVHRAIVIAKTENTPKAYPRRFAKIQKEPL